MHGLFSLTIFIAQIKEPAYVSTKQKKTMEFRRKLDVYNFSTKWWLFCQENMCDNYSKVNWANCVGKYNYVLLEQYINYY